MKRRNIFTLMFLFGIANASAAGPPEPMQKSILARAQEGGDGVIVAVTKRGNIAADTAWLLSAQVKQNDSYVPLLLVLKPDESESELKTFGLTETMLPALIYYDHNGREISRVIGVYPMANLKLMRAANRTLSLNQTR
jgi:DNA-directed RNA polymerase subunit H (RpoH/RPB5)